jgi:hypothetical protein
MNRDYFSDDYKPVPMTLREFMGDDYDKGEDFIPHSENQPVSAPARTESKGSNDDNGEHNGN